ncbi:hypothetical protein ACFOGJ_06010 [Marinibaculum pumilum]|uniref:Uncharacterized protein n=1 Tax=Marinibaculum pumilum TaxID=1766165 RepID=A0ABV7KWL5_9PROT
MPALLTVFLLALGLSLGLTACKTTVSDPTASFQRLQFLERNGT